MKKLLAILCLLPSVALAGSATLTWVPPTQREDGSAYTDYGGFKIYFNKTGQTPLVIDLPDNTNTLTTHTIETLSEGTWNFYMTAYNSAGAESAPSNTLSKIITVSPLPPDPTFVTVETGVYNVVKREAQGTSPAGFVFIYVGTAPLGTPCDKNQTVNGKYAIPVTAVTWAGTVKPVVVLAVCSEK